MEYRKIDQLTAQLEKELAEVRRVRAELEAYKGQFAIEVKNTAQKEIDGLIAQLNKLGS